MWDGIPKIKITCCITIEARADEEMNETALGTAAPPTVLPFVWHGMAWHGMAWHGMAWHGMAWACTVYVAYDMRPLCDASCGGARIHELQASARWEKSKWKGANRCLASSTITTVATSSDSCRLYDMQLLAATVSIVPAINTGLLT